MFEQNFDRRAFVRVQAVPQEPMDATSFRILQGQIIEERHHPSQVLAHRCKHSQRKLRAPAKQTHELTFWDNNDCARRQGARVSRIAFTCGKRGFRKRFAGMENVDDLHFAGRVNPMDVDHAPMHDEESSAGIPLTKEVFVFLKISYC